MPSDSGFLETRPRVSSAREPHDLEEGGVDSDDSGAAPELPNYVIIQRLAVGGMASIFLAQRSGAAEICVIKQLHAHFLRDPVVANRFLREARVASLLQHRNIARLTDAKWEKGLLYLAIEFIAGQDIESMVLKLMERSRMLPPELSLAASLDVLDGLHYAHEFRDAEGKHLEIVHRDLSPRNVMITYEGETKIIDFGLARSNLGQFRTAPGMVLGTLRYMSPEQAVAEPVDHRSDIYSWCVVLYEMLSGRPLVTGSNAPEVLRAVVAEAPPPLSSLNPSLPQALDAVLAKGLAKNRRERFDTAIELREAIARAAGPLAQSTDERRKRIGQFVSQLFPEERAQSHVLIEEARSGAYAAEPTRYELQHDVTRALTVTRMRVRTRRSSPEALPPDAYPVTMARLPSSDAAQTPLPFPSVPDTLIHDPVGKTAHLPMSRIPRARSTGLRNLVIPGMLLFVLGFMLAAVYLLRARERETVQIPATPSPATVNARTGGTLPQAIARPGADDASRAPERDHIQEDHSASIVPQKSRRTIVPTTKAPDARGASSRAPGALEMQHENPRAPRTFKEIWALLESDGRLDKDKREPPSDDASEPPALEQADVLIRKAASKLPADKRSAITSCLTQAALIPVRERWAKERLCLEKLEAAHRSLDEAHRSP